MADEIRDHVEEWGHGKSTQTGYLVQARSTAGGVQKHNGVLLTRDWVTVPFVIRDRDVHLPEGSIGIPSSQWAARGPLAELRMTSCQTAYTAALAFGIGALCVETRLVAVEVVSEYRTREVGVTEPVSLFEMLRHGVPLVERPAAEKA